MTPDDGAFLTELHQALEQRALEPGDPRCVPTSDYPGTFRPRRGLELSRRLARSSVGSIAFLTGPRGSGKSTRLLRLKAELSARGFAVDHVNLEDYLNLRSPLDIVELLNRMVGAISDSIDHVHGTDFGHVRHALHNLFDRHAMIVRLNQSVHVFAVPQWVHVRLLRCSRPAG